MSQISVWLISLQFSLTSLGILEAKVSLLGLGRLFSPKLIHSSHQDSFIMFHLFTEFDRIFYFNFYVFFRAELVSILSCNAEWHHTEILFIGL